MSSLCTLQQARRQLATDSTGTVATDNDPTLFDYIVSASDALEDWCGNPFAPRYQLMAFNSWVGNDWPILQLDDHPLVQADSIVNGDAVAFTVDQYSLLPLGQWPKQQIRLAPGVYYKTPVPDTCIWPFNYYASGPYYQPPDYPYAQDAIAVTGIWCFNRKWGTARIDTGLTLDADITSSDTTLTLSALVGTAFDVGSEIILDNEVMRVIGPLADSLSSGFDADTITVDRDYDNYTDTSRAAAHTAGTVIYVYTPEPTVVHCAAMAVAAFYKQRDNATGDQQIVSGGTFGSASIITPQDLPSRVKNLLQWPFRSHRRGRSQ